jgi:Arc/MetJ family transcription regulator
MKRTNLVLDDKLLEEARKELGTKTYSETVNAALKEAIRVKKVMRLQDFVGSGLWEGNLEEMRANRFPDWGEPEPPDQGKP